MKSYTYNQITRHTESCIREFMENARKAPTKPGTGDFEQWLFRSWAYGAFITWDRLTMSNQKEFDFERLKALAQFEVDVLIQDEHVHTQPDPCCKKCHGIGSYVEGDEYKNCECCE